MWEGKSILSSRNGRAKALRLKGAWQVRGADRWPEWVHWYEIRPGLLGSEPHPLWNSVASPGLGLGWGKIGTQGTTRKNAVTSSQSWPAFSLAKGWNTASLSIWPGDTSVMTRRMWGLVKSLWFGYRSRWLAPPFKKGGSGRGEDNPEHLWGEGRKGT